MDTKIKIDEKAITNQLAEAIATFDIAKVADLLSDNGEYCIQNEKDEIVKSNKEDFINRLNKCFEEFLFANDDKIQLNYILDQCLP